MKILKRFIISFMVTLTFLSVIVGYRKYHRKHSLLDQITLQNNQKLKEEAKKLKERKAFIKEIGPIATKVDKHYELLPSITIAQACLESDFGKSDLAKKYKNLFGVKGNNSKTSANLETKEFVKGEWKTIKARFQIYNSYEDSIRAHAKLFQKGTTWNSKQYKHVLKSKNYQEQAKALVTDGYATDPTYEKKVTDLIHQFNLDKYDEELHDHKK